MKAATPAGEGTRSVGSWWPRDRVPSLAERFSSRGNAMGLLRLALALGVLVAHSWTLGFGQPGLGWLALATHAQLNSLTVYGFFVISGFLITGSGLRTPLGVFARHRFLRIFPAYWTCLLVTAIALAPMAAAYEHIELGWAQAWQYVWTNWFTSMQQYGIDGLLGATPYGQIIGGSVFDGSLWSLKYELVCYLAVGVLAAAGVLRRHPRTVLISAAVLYLVIVIGFAITVATMARPVFPGAVGPFWLMGSFNVNQSVYLTFLFLLGVCCRLYQDRVPMHGALAAIALVVLGLSLFLGGYVVVGLPAYTYLLLYVAVAAPARLSTVGRGRDYSYGVFLYSFPVQQLLALYGLARWGLAAFILLSAVGTGALAVLSWHLVEKPVLRLKDRSITFGLAHAVRSAGASRLARTVRPPSG